MKKRFVFYVHSIAGLVAGLFILLLSFSGAALLFHNELDAIQHPAIVASPQKLASIDLFYQTVKDKYPSAQISHCALNGKSKPVSFFVYDSSYKKGTAAMELFLHPQTAQILGARGGSKDFGNNAMGWLSKFHNSFHLGNKGEWLLGVFALVFLLSILTGIIQYRKNILPVLLFKKEVYNRKSLHQLIGVYALFFNLMIAITGFWMQRYVFKKEFYAVDNYQPVLITSKPREYSFDSVFTALKNQHPTFTAYVIYFAQSNKGKTALYGSRSDNDFIHSKKMADVIFLDSTGSVAKTRFIKDIDAADRYDIINSQLHMGKFGGWGIKLLYFIFGLSGGLLSITGFLMWLKRKKPDS